MTFTTFFKGVRAAPFPEFLTQEVSYDSAKLPRTSPKEQLILIAISDRTIYGLEIQRLIETTTKENISLGSLYPILHSLAKKGLVSSVWGDETTCGARRKYYSLTSKGQDVIRNIFTTQYRLLCDDLPKDGGDD
ncbi:PadR family transcriptional regulator [Crocosphaera sp.]|uniref:PadR family transcriptional regulator n=1 Tax=Crocosphaera sp. TaxID=2729996 RepID=UPI0026096100|nr:PadR family transcriptional regulator [Crocosphaera sp.]MDJ0580972.1 PadR family transcriptional regulator [Crocosphaera sp.]